MVGRGGANRRVRSPCFPPRRENNAVEALPSFVPCARKSSLPHAPSTHRMRMFMASFLEPRRCGGGGRRGRKGGAVSTTHRMRTNPPHHTAPRAAPCSSPVSLTHRVASTTTHVIVLGRARRHDVVRRHRRGARFGLPWTGRGARVRVQTFAPPGPAGLVKGAGSTRESEPALSGGTEARGAACGRTSPVEVRIESVRLALPPFREHTVLLESERRALLLFACARFSRHAQAHRRQGQAPRGRPRHCPPPAGGPPFRPRGRGRARRAGLRGEEEGRPGGRTAPRGEAGA